MNTLPFSELVEINPRVKIEKSKEYPFVEMGIIEPCRRYVRTDQNRIFQSGGAKFLSGDTLFARITPCLENGKIAQYQDADGQAGFGSTEFFVFRARPGVSDSGFVYYLANSDLIRKPAEKSMSGASGRQRADLKSIVDLEVPFPSLPTQRKIATILSAYDDLVENNLRRIKILEEMAQNLYREWFVKFRFPGHQQTHFVDSTLGRIPEGWEVKKLGDVFDFSNGYAFYKDGYSEKGKLVVDLGNITEDRSFKLTGKDKFVSEIQYNLKSKFHLNKFDIVVAMTDMTQRMGILGKVAIIDKSNSYILNQRVGRLRPKDNKLDYSFIYTTLSDERFVQEMKVLSKGAVQKYFNTNDILNYNVLMPSADYIKKINKINLSLLEYRMLLKEKTDNLHHTRDILLPRLISGEVDVSALDITIPMEAMT